jgi:hypothetical protein
MGSLYLHAVSKVTFYAHMVWFQFYFILFHLGSLKQLLNQVCVLGAGSGMGAAAVFERGDSVDELSNARTA